MSNALCPRHFSIQRRALFGVVETIVALSPALSFARKSAAVISLHDRPARARVHGKIIIAIPLAAPRSCLCALQIKRRRPVERHKSYAMLHRINAHRPVTGMGRRMEIAIVHERLQDPSRSPRSPPAKCIAHTSCSCPAASTRVSRACVVERVSPNRSGTVQAESFNKLKSLGVYRATRPKMRR